MYTKYKRGDPPRRNTPTPSQKMCAMHKKAEKHSLFESIRQGSVEMIVIEVKKLRDRKIEDVYPRDFIAVIANMRGKRTRESWKARSMSTQPRAHLKVKFVGLALKRLESVLFGLLGGGGF